MLFFSFSTATPTPAIYTLSLHDALPICGDVGKHHRVLGADDRARRLVERVDGRRLAPRSVFHVVHGHALDVGDRKSTRLNSSHTVISYAVFCLKKKNTETLLTTEQTYHT